MPEFFGDNTPQPPPNDDKLYDVCVRQSRLIPTSLVQVDMTVCDNHYGKLSTNLLSHTEEFENGRWFKYRRGTNPSDKVVEDGTVLAPDGTLTATRYHIKNNTRFGPDDKNSNMLLVQQLEVIATLPYTTSIWLRADTPTVIKLGLRRQTSVGTDHNHRQVVTREWKRFTDTFIADASDIRGFWLLFYGGNVSVGEVAGQVEDNAFYLWGAQLEQSEFLTTYRKDGGNTSKCRAFDAGDGRRCFFTFPTCQDKENNKIDSDGPSAGIRSYYFMPHNRPVPTRIDEIVHPYIRRIGVAKQKIDPKKAVTRTDRMLIRLVEDFEPAVFDLDKLPGIVNTSNDGSFGRLFLDRHRNYVDRALTIKEGFVDNRATTRARYNLGGDTYSHSGYTNVKASDTYSPAVGFGMVPHGFALVNREDDATLTGDQRWNSAIASQIGNPASETLPFQTTDHVATAGTGSTDWSNASSVLLSDDADAVNAHSGGPTALVVSFDDFLDTEVPADAVVIGMSVLVEGTGEGAAEEGRRIKVELYSDTSLKTKLTGTTFKTHVMLIGDDTIHIVGGKTDVWGSPQGFDRDEIFGNVDFGIGITPDGAGPGTIFIDQIKLVVYWVNKEKFASTITSPNGEWANPSNARLWDTADAVNSSPAQADWLVFKNWDITEADFVGAENSNETSVIFRARLAVSTGVQKVEFALSMDGGLTARSAWVTSPTIGPTVQHYTADEEIAISPLGITALDMQSDDFAVIMRPQAASANALEVDFVQIYINRALLASAPLAHFRADVDTPGIYKVTVGVGYADLQTLMSVLTINGITVASNVTLDRNVDDSHAADTIQMVTAHVFADTHIDVQWVGSDDVSATRTGDANVAIVEIVPSSFPLSEFRSIFRGDIKEITTKSDGTWTIEATDVLKKLKKKIPPKQDDDTTFTVDVAVDNTVLNLSILTSFTDPDDLDVSVTFRIGDKDAPLEDIEYVVVSEIDIVGQTITVSRGRWGSTAKVWLAADAPKIVEVLMIGQEVTRSVVDATIEGNESTTVVTMEGINVIEAAILILQYAGIEKDLIDIETLERERVNWGQGLTVRRIIVKESSAEKLLTQLREVTMLQLWTTEDQIVSGRFLAPPLPNDSVVSISDNDLQMMKTNVVDDDDSRLTRITLAFDFPEDDPDAEPDKVEDYTKLLIRVAGDSEDKRNYGDEKNKTIKSQWISSSNVAALASARMLNRFRSGERRVKFRLHIQKAGSLYTGDFFDLTSKILQDAWGTNADKRQMLVLARKSVADELVEYEALDTVFLKRAAMWGNDVGAGALQYDVEGAVGKRHWHLGENVSNLIGEDGDEGYYIP